MKTPALLPWARRLWQRVLRRLGPVGLGGAVLLAAGVAMTVLLPGLQRGTEQAQDALLARRHALAVSSASAPTPALSDEERLERYVGSFPPLSQNASDLREMFASAERAHVTLNKGDYALRADAGSPFVTYTATFPLHEPYAAVKEFAANLLRAVPHAALDELRVGRPDANSTVLEATVRVTVIYRRP